MSNIQSSILNAQVKSAPKLTGCAVSGVSLWIHLDIED